MGKGLRWGSNSDLPCDSTRKYRWATTLFGAEKALKALNRDDSRVRIPLVMALKMVLLGFLQRVEKD